MNLIVLVYRQLLDKFLSRQTPEEMRAEMRQWKIFPRVMGGIAALLVFSQGFVLSMMNSPDPDGTGGMIVLGIFLLMACIATAATYRLVVRYLMGALTGERQKDSDAA